VNNVERLAECEVAYQRCGTEPPRAPGYEVNWNRARLGTLRESTTAHGEQFCVVTTADEALQKE
jgi:hypothetical protein